MTHFVTDGGLETDLIYHHGFDLPDFASFPLVEDAAGRAALSRYYDGYAAIAAGLDVGLQLDTPTWRANPDWASRQGYDAAALARVNEAAVGLVREVADRWSDRVPVTRVSGQLGPRGDGYRRGDAVDPDEAADYHRPQLAALAAARGRPRVGTDAHRRGGGGRGGPGRPRRGARGLGVVHRGDRRPAPRRHHPRRGAASDRRRCRT